MIWMLAAAITLTELPPQRIAPGQCLTFLWNRSEPPRRVAMLDDRAGVLRIMRDGRATDLARGTGGRYHAGSLVATLELAGESRPGMADDQKVVGGTLLLEETGQDSLLLAVGGLSGCAPQR